MMAIESQGLRLPRAWEACVAGMAGVDLVEYQFYLNEFAREVLTSAGRTTPIVRQFHHSIISYRSAYLDTTYEKYGFAAIPQIEALLSDMKKANTEAAELRDKLNREISIFKQQEVVKFFERRQQLNSITDFEEILAESAKQRNYIFKNRYWCKASADFEYRMKIDRGRKNSWTFSIPWEAYIRQRSDQDFMYSGAAIAVWCPGLRKYESYNGAAEAILGVNALVIAFDTLWSMLATGKR